LCKQENIIIIIIKSQDQRFECHPLQDHFITRLFAIVVKVTKLSFFLVCLTGKLIWAPFCKKEKKNTNPLAKIPTAAATAKVPAIIATTERYTYSGFLQGFG
jgi:hypothetical protein